MNKLYESYIEILEEVLSGLNGEHGSELITHEDILIMAKEMLENEWLNDQINGVSNDLVQLRIEEYLNK